jgi:hypothetical protein
LILHHHSISEFGDFPILILAIGKVAADDEGDTAFIEFALSKLVRVTLTWLRSDHQRSVL